MIERLSIARRHILNAWGGGYAISLCTFNVLTLVMSSLANHHNHRNSTMTALAIGMLHN